jgi:diamine N-acetyltransferase
MSSREDFAIRPATVSDAAMLSDFGAAMFEQAFGAVNTPEDMRDYLASAFFPEKQRAELADASRATFIAVEGGGAPIGYAMLRRDSTGPGVVAKSPGELQRIYADKRWHGQGVGDALLSRCVEQANAWNCDVLWLGVWQENPRAIAFYRRSGFVTVGVQTFTVGRDVQHDFVMARPL